MIDEKRKSVLARIESLEQAIRKGTEYLENGTHADWHGFRPLFIDKVKDGKMLPPHRVWVKHVFLPRRQRALARAERILDRLVQKDRSRTLNNHTSKASG